MPKTVARTGETIEDTLKRFKKDVMKSGVLAEARKKEYYVKPSVAKKLRRKENAKNK